MIQEKLNEKIDETVASTQLDQALNEPAEDSTINVEPVTGDAIDTPTSDVFSTDVPSISEPEPLQVAGKFGALKSVISKRVAEAEKKVVPPIPDEPVQQIGGQTVIREATDEELTALDQAIGGTYTKGINFPQIAEGMEDFDLADYAAKLKDANSELFEAARRGTINFDQIKELAEQIGLEDTAAYWLNRAPGSGDTAEKVLAGLMTAMELSRQTREAFVAARALPDGPERIEAMAKARQMMTMEMHLYANISGAGSEAGRTLYALRSAQTKLETPDLQARADDLTALLDDSIDAEHLAELYMVLPDAASRNRFTQNLIGKPSDALIEIWINSILTAPTTHLVNILGNSMFMATRQVENFVAAGIGKARTGLGIGSRDRMTSREAIASLEGIRKSWRDALIVAGKTLWTEEPSDFVTKIDVRDRRAIGTTGDPAEVVQMIREGNIGAAFVNAIGIQVRMGGRFLLAEDEFFKGIGYRAELHRMAAMRAGQLYDELIESGKTPQEAAQAATVEEARILQNPPHGIVKDAQEAARVMTFQGDLGDNFFGRIQGGMSNPIAKLFVPFYKTPSNVVKETVKRSPLYMAFPSFWKKIASGGRDADMALSQLSIGSAIMSSFAYMSMGLDDPNNDLIIMGNGPTNPRAKQAMGRLGIQPNSINIRQEDGNYKSITFSRLDPISGMLVMAADFAYYAQYEDDQAVVDQLAMAAALGISQYAMDMPFLQGVQELSVALTNPDPRVRMESLMELMGQKTTELFLAPLPTVSSFSAGIERQIDPTASSPLLPETGFMGEDPTQLPAFMRGFYTALQKAKGRNPFFSDTVEPKLNLWGEEVQAGTGAGWEFWSPIRIQDTKFSVVDEELMNLGLGVAMNPKKIDGVLLNAEQYNRWIMLQSKRDAQGRMPEDEGYDASTTLLPVLAEVVMSPGYQAKSTREDKLKELTTIIGLYRSAAKKSLIAEDPYLEAKINAVQ